MSQGDTALVLRVRQHLRAAMRGDTEAMANTLREVKWLIAHGAEASVLEPLPSGVVCCLSYAQRHTTLVHFGSKLACLTCLQTFCSPVYGFEVMFFVQLWQLTHVVMHFVVACKQAWLLTCIL